MAYELRKLSAPALPYADRACQRQCQRKRREALATNDSARSAPPYADRACSWRLQLQHLLQVPTDLRSVDSGGLMRRLTPFRINTSRKSRRFRIAFIVNDFKPTRINTSVILRFKPSRINTSKKHGGGRG